MTCRRDRALTATDLGGIACEPHHRATEQTTHKLENNYTNKFSHCCESSRAHNTFPDLGISVRLRTPREFDFEGQWDLITELPQDWGNRPLCIRTQKKGTVTPQETEPDLPVSVQESQAEAWVNIDQPWGQGH